MITKNVMSGLLDRVHFLYIITMVTKNVMSGLLDRVHFLYIILYLWQPRYDDKCGGEPEWERTHIVTVVRQRIPQVNSKQQTLPGDICADIYGAIISLVSRFVACSTK